MVRVSLLFLPLLAACNEYRVNNQGPDVPPGVPNIAVDPIELDFGSIAEGSEVARSVRISNLGTADLVVDAVTFEGSAAFAVPDPGATLRIDQGSSVIQEVTWTPDDEIDEGTMRIHSNDPDTPEADVALTGHGLFGELILTPDPLTFDELSVGCAVTSSVELRNDGAGPITVHGVSVTGTGFVLGAAPAWPVTLEPGGTSLVDVKFEPLVADDLSGTFSAESTDRRGLRTSAIDGVAVAPAHVVEEFEQANGSQIDLMFFIDSSCSMTDDAENLASNFDLFLDELLNGGVDYHVMVVTNQDGCHNDEIITPLTVDPETVFGDAIVGAGGSYSEAGLVVTSLALAQTGAGLCNEGFMRVGVPVVTVMVSDEPDQSPGTWLDQVLDMQMSAPDVVVNGVVGQIGNTCGANNGSGYHEAIAATGGVDLDICDADWGTYVSQILGTADLLSSFALGSIPNPDTISVTVDGDPAFGWTFDDVINIVEFDPDMLPPEGATIVVEYDEAVTCI